jgi:integrase
VVDIDWKNSQIYISRVWSKGETPGKNKRSMTQVVMHPVLATALNVWRRETLYQRDTDWIFASFKAKGRIPRSACKLGQDYLRPAAVKAGVIPDGFQGRFGWHNLRHSLATFLAAHEVNLPVIQSVLRHAKPTTTAVYTHRVDTAQLNARGSFLRR